MKRTKRKRFLQAAGKADNVSRHIAATKFSGKKNARYKTRKMGKFGAASEVRVIVKNGEPVG